MKLIKLTAFTSLLFVFVLGISSCEKIAEKKKNTDYQKNDIPMTGAKVVPTSSSPALGKLTVFYTKETRILNYSFFWSGLSGNPTGIGVYGLAPEGYSVSPTAPIQTIATTGLTTTGTITGGTLLADGFVIKEQDLLNGFYYVMIRTASNPNGEIRAQIVFQ